MNAAKTTVLAVLLMAGCSDAHGPHEVDDWSVLNEVGTPGHWEMATWPVDDNSCLAADGIQVLGDVDSKEFAKIILEVRSAHPRDAILLVRRLGRYADVLTGANCTAPGAGGGEIYLMRLEGATWHVKGTTKWH